jgi:hypothetical protein
VGFFQCGTRASLAGLCQQGTSRHCVPTTPHLRACTRGGCASVAAAAEARRVVR